MDFLTGARARVAGPWHHLLIQHIVGAQLDPAEGGLPHIGNMNLHQLKCPGMYGDVKDTRSPWQSSRPPLSDLDHDWDPIIRTYRGLLNSNWTRLMPA